MCTSLLFFSRISVVIKELRDMVRTLETFGAAAAKKIFYDYNVYVYILICLMGFLLYSI